MYISFEKFRTAAVLTLGLSIIHPSGVIAGVTILPGLGPDYWQLDDASELSRANGINNSGVVVGSATSNPRLSGEGAAVRWTGGAIEVLPRFPDAAPNGGNFVASDVSDAGVVVGFSSYQTPGSSSLAAHAAKWTEGAIVNLGTLPGHESSYALAINEAGQIAGMSRMGFFFGDDQFPVRWSAVGQITPLGLLPTQDPLLIQSGRTMHDRGDVGDINDSGRIVGYSELFGGDYPQELLPVYWDDVDPVALPLPVGFNYGKAAGINNSGKIVGHIATYAYDSFSAPAHQAAIWNDASSEPQILDLPSDILDLPSDVVFSSATAVNSRGQVIGEATNSSVWIENYPSTSVLLWEPDGSVIDLTPRLKAAFPGGTRFRLTDINDLGQISGYAEGQFNINMRDGAAAFVLAIPEPTSLLLLTTSMVMGPLSRPRRHDF